MSKSFDRVRGYIYPRSMNFQAVLIAHAIMLIAG